MNIKKVHKLIKKNTFSACIPLISNSRDELLSDVEMGVANGCDFLEWRRDHFMPGVTLTTGEEIELLKEIKTRMPNQGLIYTYRSHREGGVFETPDAIRLIAVLAAIKSNRVDYVDVELASEPAFLEPIKGALKTAETQWLVSHHNFEKTLATAEMAAVFSAMEDAGGDVLKLAVMPHSMDDVRHLIQTTLAYNEKSEKPMIAIAMGSLGAITRIAPDLCGGSLTYAAGAGKTAPGQLSLEEIVDLRKRMALI
ncbi:type I 3-dehydroquinate dehydratase [uncultured Acetobacterium sp.]|uniref:type I 3-dehydroquinate dehydratase n=1 Tax=uncultured Acetobacterium sp. TaxID=217139 RepID=UPI0025D7E64E|nr:type I 3-dehydroquinate dehydratase [uncultured Acetobacterium sp.]